MTRRAVPEGHYYVGAEADNRSYSLIQNVTGGATVPSEENVTEGTGADAERMTVDERRKCLKRMQGRYLGGSA